MDGQRFAISGRIFDAEDDGLQGALARVHDSPSRPRCLCVPGGVEMYVAHHRQYLAKRMPDTGDRHHPSCPSYEPGPAASGLGELLGEAVIQIDPVRVELRVEFPWVHRPGRSSVLGVGQEAQPAQETSRPRRHLSLRALMHFLFERAGFNRWSPAMAGKRNQAVLHKYLMQAAEDVLVKGDPLTSRLYVPEAFNAERKAELADRRRARLAVLQSEDGGKSMAVVIGEFKGSEPALTGQRIWIRHMSDAPLLADAGTWARVQRRFASLFEARDADGGAGLRVMMAALIRARRENTYEIELASVMLANEEWIPLDGVHEARLLRALVTQGRRFIKPLRYDARTASAFANAMLLDAGPQPVALHVVSPFMPASERDAKARAIEGSGAGRAWVWNTSGPMPPLPDARACR